MYRLRRRPAHPEFAGSHGGRTRSSDGAGKPRCRSRGGCRLNLFRNKHFAFESVWVTKKTLRTAPKSLT